MAADTYSNFLGALLQGTGNNANTWGTNLNASDIVVLEKAIAGNISRAVTGGSLDLSGSPPPAAVAQALEHIQIFTGVLTSHQTVIVANLSKTWKVFNNTTGAFKLYLKTTAGTATEIPQGTIKEVVCDGANGVFRMDKEHIGNFIHHGSNNIPAGSVLCDGSSLLRADWPDLFGVIGATWGAADGTHFSLPLLTDTSRFLRAAKPGTLGAGNYQSNQNLAHTHSITGGPSVGSLGTDNPGNHTHANFLTDGTHTHLNPIQRSGQLVTSGTGSAGEGVIISGLNLPFSSANISITNAAAGGHTHTITGSPGVGTLAIASSGGSEARPESAVALICMKY